MFTIKRTAELTGIPVATLRAWETRYGIVSPQRSSGGYRLYTLDDVRALTLMNQLVEQGWAPQQAVHEARRLLQDEQSVAEVSRSSTVRGGRSRARARVGLDGGSEVGSDVGSDAAPRGVGVSGDLPVGLVGDPRVDGFGRNGVAGTGSVLTGRGVGAVAPRPAPGVRRLPVPEARQLPRALADAGAALDEVRVEAILDEALSRASFEVVVDDWLMPALYALGNGWATGEVSIAGEHMVASAVQRRLATAYEAAARAATGPLVLLGLPPQARHELGLLAFATAVRRQGLRTAYFGADLPVSQWEIIIRHEMAAAVVMSVVREVDLLELKHVVERIDAIDPQLIIGVGGACQEMAPQRCLRLGHRIGDAAELLARQLRSPGDQPPLYTL